MNKPIIYHIPVCPFSQRVEILLACKGLSDAVEFRVIDITEPRPGWLLEKTGDTTALPILETEAGGILKESLVILRYVEERWTKPRIARADPFERGIERLFISREGPFGMAGYRYVMNTDRAKTEGRREALLGHYRWLGEMLEQHNADGTWLFDRFGLPEIVYTPLMMRFWFLEHYEGFALPETPDYDRVRRWRAACIQHPAAQQVCYEADCEALLRLRCWGGQRRAARRTKEVEFRVRAKLARPPHATLRQVRRHRLGCRIGVVELTAQRTHARYSEERLTVSPLRSPGGASRPQRSCPRQECSTRAGSPGFVERFRRPSRVRGPCLGRPPLSCRRARTGAFAIPR